MRKSRQKFNASFKAEVGLDALREEHDRETAKLYKKIGQLTVERDFLVKSPDR